MYLDGRGGWNPVGWLLPLQNRFDNIPSRECTPEDSYCVTLRETGMSEPG